MKKPEVTRPCKVKPNMDDLRSGGLVLPCLVCCCSPWQSHPIARLSVSSKNEDSHHTIQSPPSTHQCGQRVVAFISTHTSTPSTWINHSLILLLLASSPRLCFPNGHADNPSFIDLRTHKPDIKSFHNPTIPVYPRSSPGFFNFFVSKSLAIQLEVGSKSHTYCPIHIQKMEQSQQNGKRA